MTAPITTAYITAIKQHTPQQINSTLIKAFNKDSLKRLLNKALKYVVAKGNYCDCLSFYMIVFLNCFFEENTGFRVSSPLLGCLSWSPGGQVLLRGPFINSVIA
jgi:hypothetical protein